MARMFLTALCLAFVASICAESFQGHKVVRIHPETRAQYDLVAKFLDDNGLMTWKEVGRIGDSVEVVVSPAFLDSTRRHFGRLSIRNEVIVDNVGKVLEETMEHNNQIAANVQAGERYDNYQTLEQINEWFDEVAADCGDACEVVDIGQSYEGRTIKVFKIVQGDGSKPNIWVDGGIHAREWISPPVVMYFIEQIVENMKNGGDLVDRFDWYFLPLINVDGYEYSWTTNRLWRKSRQTWANTTCEGTDINRNFDFMWMTIGASNNPCSETFAGWFANSEPEAVAVDQYVMNNVADGGLIFVTTHSYSQLWMTPWGYSFDDPPNYDNMFAAGMVAADAIKEVNGIEYEVGPASTIIYPSSGTLRDWAAGVPQFPYVYTIELRPGRDSGLNGFILPPEEIRPSVLETWAGFEAMVNFIQPAE